jgi:hypothetical protein
LRFFGNQIRHENGIDSGLLCFTREPILAKLQEGVEIAKQYNRRIDVASGADYAIEHGTERCVISQGALRRTLNDFAVSNGIAERDPQLNDIRSSRRKLN